MSRRSGNSVIGGWTAPSDTDRIGLMCFVVLKKVHLEAREALEDVVKCCVKYYLGILGT